MTIHRLKILPEYFKPVASMRKPFEARKNDRDFKIGDHLHLMEYDPELDHYSGRLLVREISYILPGGAWGIEPGYVVLGLKTI